MASSEAGSEDWIVTVDGFIKKLRINLVLRLRYLSSNDQGGKGGRTHATYRVTVLDG